MSNEPNIHVIQAILERVEHKLDKHAENSVTRAEHEELKSEVKGQKRIFLWIAALVSAVSSAITKGVSSL